MKENGKLLEKMRALLAESSGELASIESNLLSAAREREIKTLLVTSCHASEGKTLSAVSIAYMLCENTNARVLLIDGNLHSPKIHQLFEIESSPGLTDFFSSEVNHDELFRKTDIENLMIMPHGTSVSNSSDVFKSRLLKLRLDQLKGIFDYVIFDGHSILTSSDVSFIARYFDGIVIVVECEKTRWEVLQLAKEKLDNVGGNIIGVVLNKRKYYIPRVLYGHK